MPNPVLFTQRDDHCVLEHAQHEGDSVLIGPQILAGVRAMACYVVFGPKALGGTVIIEGAQAIGHVGEWAKLSEVNWVKGGRVHRLATSEPHLAIRIRVSRAILGDTVSVYAIGN